MVIDNYFNLGLLMGAVFSFLLSMYLIFYPNNFFPNKILGVLVFTWSITVFAFIIQSPDFFAKYPHFYALWDVFTLMFFPLIYLYIRHYLYKDIKVNWSNLWHFAPSIAYLITFSPFFLQSGEAKIQMINNGFPVWFGPLQTIFNLTIILQGTFYSIYSLRTIHHFQYFRKNRLSDFQLNSLSWLRLFVLINIFLWIAGTTGAFLDIFGIDIFIDLFDVFYLGLTLLTIVLGIFTMQRPELFEETEDILALLHPRKSNSPQSQKKGYTPEEFQTLSQYIVDKKPYLKNDLKMQDMVEATGLSYKRISEMLNSEFEKSFYELMNEYRLEEAIRLINEGFHIKHTLPYLADAAGFNSKTTFNRAFKKYTGKTPTEYIQSLD
ncbi:helix-turn-helix domain-containing protein [Reichenbachiella ulvae]|uniref:AraC family transcriptional regulator n=1 Tax=Reichenbachiella ulvae TaxID=2980104 RepID=A0ABT3CNU2_9BACT|nr:helix-turn-helix domain-containing protein [Reichenbachiella ulvae]MCV9385231.1 AraC family transcriptional regulator [Reichenbachiella ulvae]